MSALRTIRARLGGEGRPLLGLAAILMLVGLLTVAIASALGVLSSPDRDTVSATFADTARLKAGDPVRIDGVEVGEVGDITADLELRDATVALEIDPSAGPLYADARAAIKWTTLLGGRFVVDLERGTLAAGRLRSGAIPERRTSTQVELDDLISFDRGRARAGLKAMPGELARALRDPEAPAGLLRTLDDVAPAVARGLRATRGERPERDLRALVSNTARTVRALDRPTDELRGVVSGAAATLETTARREADLRRFLAGGPGTLRSTRVTLGRLNDTLGRVDPLIARLRESAPQIAPTVRDLRPTVVEADRLLRRATPLFRSLRPAASSLAATARRGLPLLDGLAPSLERLDEKILPFMGEIDPQTEHSASQMIGPTLAALGPAMAGNFDGNGHFLRFPIVGGPNTVQTAPCQSLITNPDPDELATCKSLQEAIETYPSYDPLGPAWGTTPPHAGGEGGD